MKCVFCKVGETHPQRVTVEKYNESGEPVALIQSFPLKSVTIAGKSIIRRRIGPQSNNFWPMVNHPRD